MKLLLDQNLSFKLVPKLEESFPGTKHIKDHQLTDKGDEVIWRLAKEQGFTIVSKDSDFFHRSIVLGHPPKVIQLRVGNCSTTRILNLWHRKEAVIKEFLQDSSESVLILTADKEV